MEAAKIAFKGMETRPVEQSLTELYNRGRKKEKEYETVVTFHLIFPGAITSNGGGIVDLSVTLPHTKEMRDDIQSLVEAKEIIQNAFAEMVEE